jgi:hypothetical protein
MCSGVVPQQPPATLTKPAVANSPSSAEVTSGRLVEAGVAHRIGQAGVRVHAQEGVGLARQLFDVRAHQRRAQRAVQADGERPGVAHRIPEGLDRLARQDAARRVGDRARDHQRQPVQAGGLALGHDFVDREQRRLRVQRVEDGLDQQQVDPALDQPAVCSA